MDETTKVCKVTWGLVWIATSGFCWYYKSIGPFRRRSGQNMGCAKKHNSAFKDIIRGAICSEHTVSYSTASIVGLCLDRKLRKCNYPNSKHFAS